MAEHRAFKKILIVCGATAMFGAAWFAYSLYDISRVQHKDTTASVAHLVDRDYALQQSLSLQDGRLTVLTDVEADADSARSRFQEITSRGRMVFPVGTKLRILRRRYSYTELSGPTGDTVLVEILSGEYAGKEVWVEDDLLLERAGYTISLRPVLAVPTEKSIRD